MVVFVLFVFSFDVCLLLFVCASLCCVLLFNAVLCCVVECVFCGLLLLVICFMFLRVVVVCLICFVCVVCLFVYDCFCSNRRCVLLFCRCVSCVVVCVLFPLGVYIPKSKRKHKKIKNQQNKQIRYIQKYEPSPVRAVQSRRVSSEVQTGRCHTTLLLEK